MFDLCSVFVFFFQAEDGIRDLTVTGVQTCALPILTGIDFIQVSPNQTQVLAFIHHLTVPAPLAAALATITPQQTEIRAEGRSEERRVGKECRCRWSPAPRRKKIYDLCEPVYDIGMM